MLSRVRSARLLRRLIILLTGFSVCGSLFIWLCLYTDSNKPRGTRQTDILVLSSHNERLDWGISSRSLKRNVVKDFQASSMVARNVFGIEPVVNPRRAQIPFNGKKDNHNGIIQIGLDSRESKNIKKYMFVFHHYEQFSKTTENFVQLCAIAAYGSRKVVQPFVRDSRMCGLESGWWGESLTKSRLFRPLSTYFDVNSLNEVLSQNGYATVEPLLQFKHHCNQSNINMTLVHFLYKDGKETTKKWFDLTESQYQNIEMNTRATGWTNCPVLDKGLNISRRLGGLRTGRQVCVSAERVRDHKQFEDEVLIGDQCVVIIFWKGFGIDRTHFKPKVKVDARGIVHRLHHSTVITQEAELFKKTFLDQPFIGVHVRSERQILWYSTESLLKCINLVIKTVTKLKQKHKIDTVFLATDLTKYGSDTLLPKTAASLRQFEKLFIDGLTPKQYSPHTKDLLLRDHGIVAIVEMNILSYSNHLVTLGSGSFQEWVMDLFMSRKSDMKPDWTISRVCSKEKKIH